MPDGEDFFQWEVSDHGPGGADEDGVLERV